MQGLRTQETKKFERFFALVQDEAKKKDMVFFLNNGEGNDFETDTLEGEDLCGWLVPKENVAGFEKKWLKEDSLESFSEFICFAFWKGDKNAPRIIFQSF